MAFDSTHSFPLNPPAFENDTKCLQFIEEMTRNVAAVQEKVLAKILTKNAEVEAQPRTGLLLGNQIVPTTEESRDSVRFLTVMCQGLYFLFVRHETRTPGSVLARPVLALGAIFASGLMLELCRFLQHHWQVLVNDIETDTLNQKITERSIRDCMAKILKPGPELAEFIKTDCSTENWGGTITRI
ncbi:hypothetical protein WN943_005396 [Citrus x changshan-huyou]